MRFAPLAGRAHTLAEGHKQVLELAASGAETDAVLKALVRVAQGATQEGARASIFLVDADAGCLRFAAGAGMSEEYTTAVDPFPIGPEMPSCGLAAYTGDEIIVPDVTKNANWEPYLALARQHGIGGVWSFPLHSAQGKVLGTFAFYHARPREPDPVEYEEAKFLANIAALVIERHKAAVDRQVEERLAVEALAEASARKDEFLAVLAHELRNPLAAIVSAQHVVELGAHVEPTARRALAIMQRQIALVVRLVDDLLDLSRVSRGKIELRLARAPLQSALQLAMESAAPLLRAKQQNLATAIPEPPVFVHADVSRVAQMVANLLNNASKFTPPGGNVVLALEAGADEATIRVRDDGIGIPVEQRERIFEMFAQVDASREHANGGLGIGLTLVRSLAVLHGGSVEAHSAGVGKGSEFVIRLPLASAPRGAVR